MGYQTIALTMEDGLARLTLNQPELGNPYNDVFCKEIGEVASALTLDTSVRAILVTAKGNFFSVGGDIKMFTKDRAALPAGILEWTKNAHSGMARLWRLEAPIVTAIHATAMGGSMGLIGGSDVVYCAESAKLGAAYALLGFSTDVGVSGGLALRMGIARARRFLLLSEMLSAKEAQQAGLVDFVVADDQVLAEAEKTARRLAQGPTRAYGQLKRLMMTAYRNSVESQLEDEALGLTRISATEDAWEGLSAFVERRKAKFTGK